MYKRFSMIDVVKSLKMTKKKDKSERLKLLNELKLITATEDIYRLWSDVITNAAHGELYNPDTNLKFNARLDWNPESCMLTREFFKFLGNLSYQELGKLAKYILNIPYAKRKHPYPKVTIKAITKVLDGHYTTKDWVERRKRKQVAVRELHRLDPSLGHMNSANEIITTNWQRFKDERCITRATMDVLLERLGEYFYSESKQTRARSKTTEELDPEAFEFFKLFLEHKNSFVRPSASGFYQSYDIIKNEFLDWPREAYSGTSLPKMALGLIDFQNLPGIDNKDSSTINCPFFVEVMTAFSAAKKPSFDEVSSWLFISGDEKENSQVLHFIESHEVLNKYGIQCRSTKTQVNPSSALNRTKHHQSNPSNVLGILDSILSKRVCVFTSKSLLTWSNRILPL